MNAVIIPRNWVAIPSMGRTPGEGYCGTILFFFISSFLKSQLCAAPNVHVVQWINIQYSREYQHVFLFRKSDFLQSRIVTRRFFLGVKLFCLWSELAQSDNLFLTPHVTN